MCEEQKTIFLSAFGMNASSSDTAEQTTVMAVLSSEAFLLNR